tara:strand:+ start:1244 stop:2371 length:1128 start_codon:yes stop_codon:yes gene_type:complete
MKGLAILPQGLEEQGARELSELGASNVFPLKRSVSFDADLACFYRLHLFGRLAFRYLRELARFECNSPRSLYLSIQKACDWSKWLDPSLTFKVDVSGSSLNLTHSHFNALQVKNAFIDFQRDKWGKRSCIDIHNPDLNFHLHLNNGRGVLSLAGSNMSLHKRGYRPAVGIAPLKENIAAGLLKISGWDMKSPLVDPLCGSSTFLIEALGMALGHPPGLHLKYKFNSWYEYEPILWEREYQSALQSSLNFNNDLPLIIGSDISKVMVDNAKQNIIKAGFDDYIKVYNVHFKELSLPNSKGWIVCNPPYGKRVGSLNDLSDLYTDLGNYLKGNASGWQLWMLSGNPELSRFIRMKSQKKFPINNGGIDCRWLKYVIN